MGLLVNRRHRRSKQRGRRAGLQDRSLRAEDVAGHLERLGQTAVWNVLNGGTYDNGVPEGEVLWGFARDPKTVHLTVRLDGDATPA